MTQTNLQFADHICQRMIANGMVRSQAEFSTTWLDQCPSYLSSSKARQRKVPDTVIQFMFDRLDLRMQNYRAQANHVMGIKLWRDGYEKAMLLHVQVQNHLTWKAADRDAQQFAEGLLAQRTILAAKGQPRTSAMAKLIEFAALRKSP